MVWFVVLSLFINRTLRHNSHYCTMLAVYVIYSYLDIVIQKSGSDHMPNMFH